MFKCTALPLIFHTVLFTAEALIILWDELFSVASWLESVSRVISHRVSTDCTSRRSVTSWRQDPASSLEKMIIAR